MVTITRSIRCGFLAPFIVIALIGALTSCTSPGSDTGPSNSISKGSDAAVRTGLKTDANNMVNGLAAFNGTDGKYPAAANTSELATIVNVRLNPGNYVSDYGLSGDGSAFTFTLSNDTLATNKSIQYSSNTGLYR